MKFYRWAGLFVIFSMLLGACASPSGGDGPGPISIGRLFPSPTPLPPPVPTIISAPDARAAVSAYLDALKGGNYSAMYAMLTKISQETITLEDFTKLYTEALNQMSAGSLDYEILSSLLSPYNAQVGYRITYHTALVGDIQRDIVMELSLDQERWGVKWTEALILPELASGNHLAMDYQIPARGDIYDRDGNPVATQSDIFAFGIDTGAINYDMIDSLTGELARLCGRQEQDIKDQISASGPGWYLAMCEGTRAEAERLLALNPGGLAVTSYTSRYYVNQGAASPITGYVHPIDPTQLDEYRRMGYRGDERVGQQGIEKWAEQYLGGKHGGSLYVADANGQIITRLGESQPQAADSVYLTIDNNMQYWAEQALRPFRGAVVVLERDTGRVLAMASSPSYDANLFDPNTPNSDLLVQLLSDQNQPLVNRAAQGQYPLGSVFKIITFSAALESGLYLPATTYDCQYDFTELVQYGGPILHDWTWQHCQDALAAGEACDGRSELPSGLLTLPEGLMRSCNPYFWHIGLDLFNNNRAGDISKMADGFGLGKPTGIGQIAEAAGQIVTPTDQVGATNQAIGQGEVQVTPLQVASFIAAVGNGGTLYRPQVVEKISSVDGETVLTFKPEARGTLPLRKDNLQVLQDALRTVVSDPRGTANFRLRGLNVPVAGKTGTAESGSGKSHAWFAGYTTSAANANLPDIAIAVIIENIGEGSDYAAPVFRWMVETYFYGAPQSIPWFGPIGEMYTPTPFGGIPTKTPKAR
jgi:penicillin-binding protein 2